MKFKTFLFSTFVQLIAWISFYIVIGGDNWVTDKLKEIIFASIVFFIVTLMGTLTFLFRPLFLIIKQNNIMDLSMKETFIDIQKQKLKTFQNQRTISISIIYQRRGSIWWKLFKRILMKNKVILSFKSIPSSVGIEPVNIQNPAFSTNSEQGFDIELNRYFFELFNSTSEYSVEEKYEYVVILHPEFYDPTSAIHVIEPIIKIKGQTNNLNANIQRTLLKILLKTEIELHKLRISKR